MLKQVSLVKQATDIRVNKQDLAKNDQKKLLEFVKNLHSSLDCKVILQNFITGLKSYLHYDSISYVNNSIGCHFHKGNTEAKRYSYHLSIDKEMLGEVIITRQLPLEEEELLVLEEILCFLVNPLKNAIDHHHALQAALHDPLTGLYNRGALTQALQREIKLAQRHDQSFSIMILDLDDFKGINDRYGHIAGDEVLKHCANLIEKQIRDADMAFRIGGEEFLILLARANLDGAYQLANRLRNAFEKSNCVTTSNETIALTTSIGLSSFETGDNKTSLIARADKALYQAKQQGKNQVCG